MGMNQFHHERIDKGIKRGVGNPYPRDPETGYFVTQLPADYDDEDTINRIAAGEAPVRIAEQLGIRRQTLYMRYAGNEAYQQARAIGAEVRLDSAECEITEAQDPFTLARARERFRAVSWRCEREYPSRWGIKQPGTVVQLNVISSDVMGAASELLKLVEGTNNPLVE